MGWRERLQNNAGITKLVVVALIAFCAMVIFLEMKGRPLPDSAVAREAFYSVDDGKTWFIDDRFKDSPFDHNGKQAYRALIYRCPAGGKPFVAFLTRYSDRQRAQLAAEVAAGTAGRPMMMEDLKKPGESKWATDPALSFRGYPDVPCPDGPGNAALVSPGEPDSGATN